MVWYFSNSCCQSDGESGGSTPSTGCHSTMESPDSVTRVAPPTSTITKTNPETASSQSRIMRRCRSGGEIGSMGRDARCRGSGAQVSQALAAGQCGAHVSVATDRRLRWDRRGLHAAPGQYLHPNLALTDISQMNSGTVWTIADGGIPGKPQVGCAVASAFQRSRTRSDPAIWPFFLAS